MEIFQKLLGHFISYEQTFYIVTVFSVSAVILNYLYRKLSYVEVDLDSTPFMWTRDENRNRISEHNSKYPYGWVPLFTSEQVKANEMKPVHAFGRDLVVFRGSSGKCHTFDAYCPHLGANLGVGGTVLGDSIQCPFHGWQFNEDGVCIHVPGIDGTINAMLNKYETIEINGLICVWYNLPGVMPLWLPLEHPNWNVMQPRAQITQMINANIEMVSENAADFAHFNIHSQWSWPFNTVVDRRSIFDWITKLISNQFEFEFNVGTDENRYTCELRATAKLNILNYTLKNIKFTLKLHGPYLTLGTHEFHFFGRRQFHYVLAMTPKGPMMTQFIIKLYSEPGLINTFITRYDIFIDQSERDAFIWVNQKRLSKPMLTKNDTALAQYRRWIKQVFYTETDQAIVENE